MLKRLFYPALFLLPAVAIAQEGDAAADRVIGPGQDAESPAKGVTIGPKGPIAARHPRYPGQPEQGPGQPFVKRKPQQYKVTITPSAVEPVPPLKYRFDVPYLDRKPGNSATFYYRALVQLGLESPEERREFDDFHTAIYNVPHGEFPVEKARGILSRYQMIFNELERATVREQTDWNWRMDELDGTEAISIPLAEIQNARHFARMLEVKARFEIAEGRFDDAANTLRMGYGLSHAVAEAPTIISALVGIAIGAVMDAVVLDWIEAPNSPNVYWAVASLPDPLVDMRPALEFDLSFAFRFAPWLKTAETDDVSPAVWRERFSSLMTELSQVGDLIGGPREPSNALVAGLAVRSYPAAKRALVEEQDFDAKAVEKMPVGQVLAIRQKYVNEIIADELLKAELVPSIAAANTVERSEQSLKARFSFPRPHLAGGEPLPLMALLAPATQQAARAEWRSNTKIAGLRAIEAVRMHAATTGELPQSLDEIEIVPVPVDPTTGKPFAYKRDGDTAVIDVVMMPESPPVNWRVEFTLKK